MCTFISLVSVLRQGLAILSGVKYTYATLALIDIAPRRYAWAIVNITVSQPQLGN